MNVSNAELAYSEWQSAHFNKVAERYYGRIYAFILKMVREPELARDLTQDTFLLAYRDLVRREAEPPATAQKNNMASWLYTIACNRVRSEMRHRKVIRFIPLFLRSPENSNDEFCSFSDWEAGNLENHTATGEAVRRAIRTVGRDKLLPFLLHLDGFSYAEIGQITGDSLASVKVKIFRAKAQLRKVLETERTVLSLAVAPTLSAAC
jgi:RNA polymerase sigma-70 factor, ECF subfamily